MPVPSPPIDQLHIPVWRRLARTLQIDVRRGERRPALLLFLGFFVIVTFQYATKSVRQSAFVDGLGAENLPWVYLAVALCSYPVLRLYAALADRLRRRQVIVGSTAAIAASLVAFWWLFGLGGWWLPFVLYVWIGITYALNYSQFWSFSSHVLDPRQAKRLFGFIGAGGLLGGVAGGQVARLVSHFVDTRTTLLVAAGLIALVPLLLGGVRRRAPDLGDTGAARESEMERAQGGFEIIRRSRQLRLLSALMVVTILVAQIVDLQFNWAVEQFTTDLDQRTAFFGNFYSVMNLAAFFFQLIFTARIHRLLGVATAMRVLPTTMGLGTVALFVAATASPVAVLAAAVVLKVGETGLRYSLDQSTRELLYLPIPSRLRAKAKAYVDVFFHRGAKGLAALLLLPVTFGWLTVVDAGWLSLALVVVWLAVVASSHREYVRAFRRGLKRRSVDRHSPVNIEDANTLEILVQSLGSLDPRQVLHSLDILEDNDRGNLVPPLLLHHDDAEVRRRTLDVLARAGREDATPLIERRLADENPDVRAAAGRVLAQFKGEDVCLLMQPRLHETEPGVRAAAVACLAVHGDDEMLAAAETVLKELLSDADPTVRSEGAKAIAVVPEPRFAEYLVQLLYDSDARVLRHTIAAVRRRVRRDGHNPIYLPTLVALLRHRRVKHEARAALVALGEPVIPALAHFLAAEDEALWVRRALPKTIASIGGDQAASTLLEALALRQDRFLRRKVIEALCGLDSVDFDATGHAAIGREVEAEARLYCRELLDLCAVSPPGSVLLQGPVATWREDRHAPDLLERLLAERMEDHLRNLFGLLSLILPATHIRAAHRSLVSTNPALRAHALEYLDNTLAGDLRPTVFAVINDAPLGEKLETAARRFDLRRDDRLAVLRRAIDCRRPQDENAVGVALAALYKIHSDRIEELFGDVRRLETLGVDAQVRETASWVDRRL